MCVFLFCARYTCEISDALSVRGGAALFEVQVSLRLFGRGFRELGIGKQL